MSEVRNNGIIGFNKELTEEAYKICEDLLDPNCGGAEIMPLEIEFEGFFDGQIENMLEEIIDRLAPLGYIINGTIEYYGDYEGKVYVKDNVVENHDITEVGLMEASDKTLISMLESRGYSIQKETGTRVIADCGKTKDGHNVLVIKDGETTKFVICSNYDPARPEGQQWDWGDYYHGLGGFAKTITSYNEAVGWRRLDELATKALHILMENDLLEEDDLELEEDEIKYFGL